MIETVFTVIILYRKLHHGTVVVVKIVFNLSGFIEDSS